MGPEHFEEREQPTYFERLLARKLPLGLCAVVGIGLLAVYTIWVPARWEAKTTVLFAPATPSVTNMSSVAAAVSSSAFGGPSVLKMNKMLLESERTLEYVRQRMAFPGAESDQKEKLRKFRMVDTDQSSNTLTLTVQAMTPEEARKASHLYIGALRLTSQKFNLQRTGSDVQKLADSVVAKQKELDKAADDLQKFEEKSLTAVSLVTMGQGDNATPLATPGPWQNSLRNAEIDLTNAQAALERLKNDAGKAVDVSSTLPTYVTFTEKLRQNVVTQQSNVMMLSNKFGPAAPELIRAKRDLTVAEQQLTAEVNRYRSSFGMGTADQALTQAALKEAQMQGNVNALRKLTAAAPAEAKTYMTLVRRVALLTGVTMKFEAQLAVARLSEGNDPNRWNIVDDAVVADKPVNKSFLRNCTIGAILGILFGCAVIGTFGIGKRKDLRPR